MRIVGGRWRSRRIEPPPDARARPTTDRVREAWMSILGDRLPGARVVDLFAGSGAMGLEALSRGAAPESVRVHRADALRWAARLDPLAFDLAFADPPYTTGHAARIAALFRDRPFARILGVEHDVAEDVGGGAERRYGRTVLTFLEAP
jgi:16S rRNA (guanine966-N2)-methyltransferase